MAQEANPQPALHSCAKWGHNLDNGIIPLNENPALLDSNQYFAIKLLPYNLPTELFESNYIALRFETNHLFKFNENGYYYTPIDEYYYTHLLDKGIVIYNKKTSVIYFISGNYFRSDSKFLYRLLCNRFSIKEANELYINMLYYNYDPVNIRIRKNKLYFYSLIMNKYYSFSVDY